VYFGGGRKARFCCILRDRNGQNTLKTLIPVITLPTEGSKYFDPEHAGSKRTFATEFKTRTFVTARNRVQNTRS